MQQTEQALLDHLIGKREHIRRNGEVERPLRRLCRRHLPLGLKL
jgi:hypothetical protein